MMKNILVAIVALLSISFTGNALQPNRSPAVVDHRIRIAVIDSGINITPEIKPFMCVNGEEDMTGAGPKDTHGHGTNIAHLIARNLDPTKHCLVSIKYFQTGLYSVYNLQYEIQAFKRAVAIGSKYINLSSGGGEPSAEEISIIKKALSKNIRVIVAAGNEGQDLSMNCNYFPACSVKDDNFYVVGNKYLDGRMVPSSNFNGPVRAYRTGVDCKAGGCTMSGTSQSTAIFTGELVKQEHP